MYNYCLTQSKLKACMEHVIQNGYCAFFPSEFFKEKNTIYWPKIYPLKGGF